MDNRIVAYEISGASDMEISSAPRTRDWMDATDNQFAYRCLPLLLANQCGWVIANPTEFKARWNGGGSKESLTITFANGANDGRIKSHFGSGIVTFTLPFLFRTPKGINLLVRGPTNWIKDGVQALDGIVETDWAVGTFTMNWKLTRPDNDVAFRAGEPICMIVPLPRGLAESLRPERKPLASDEQLLQHYNDWQSSRREFLSLLSQKDPGAVKRSWQRDYFKGLDMNGKEFAEHQTQVSLQEFGRHD